MRKLIYYVASTLDGFIAHEDGSFAGFPWDDEFGADLLASFPETFPAHLRPGQSSAADNRLFDTVLMGRRTYEVGLREGISNPYPTLKQYVFSRSITERPDPDVEIVNERAADVVDALKRQVGKAIWLCGGSDLTTTLFRAGLVDELIIKLNPVVFGSGIPLLRQSVRPTRLALAESKIYRSGHMRLHYRLSQ
jgi:dihydrofolate reductase